MLRHTKQNGFTLVELLIVITVIAILAAITIVAFNGVTQKANVATLQSDLSQGYNTVSAAAVVNGTYPADQASANLKNSPGVTLTYASYSWSTGESEFCLQGIYMGLVYVVSNGSNTPQQGYCSYMWPITGTGSTSFSYPYGGTMDSSGNLYVIDSSNNCIRKVSPSQVMSLLAGICGGGGTANGTGAAAQFNWPTGAAIDSSGNLYIADNGSTCIRKITPSAVVTTFAGTCSDWGSTIGDANGTGAAASFAAPWDIAIDSSNNLFVTDETNNCIRKITPSAVVTTFAGTCESSGTANGTGAAAQFDWPTGITIDSSNNLYVADASNNCIRKITPSAVVTTLAGTCNSTWGVGSGTADGTGAAAQFHFPVSLALDSSNNLYVADASNNCIRKITPSAVVTTFVGTCGSAEGNADGTGAAAQLGWPSGVVLDSANNLYITDSDNSCIRKATPTAVVTTLHIGGC